MIEGELPGERVQPIQIENRQVRAVTDPTTSLVEGQHLGRRPWVGLGRRRRPSPAKPDRPGRGRRVLVVDDERTIRISIAGYLSDSGYAVDVAANGAEALERMRQAIPDVIVLDLLMPVMGGRAFIQACRTDPRLCVVPVVLLSAADELAQTAVELQPRASLAKPIDLDVLLAVIDRVSST